MNSDSVLSHIFIPIFPIFSNALLIFPIFSRICALFSHAFPCARQAAKLQRMLRIAAVRWSQRLARTRNAHTRRMSGGKGSGF